jgi:hypothetical protein
MARSSPTWLGRQVSVHPRAARRGIGGLLLGLAQDNLVSDVAAAETTWTHDHP